MKEWEDKAIDIIKESKATVKRSPEDYPLGWLESAIFNLQAELKDSGILIETHLDDARLSMAQQLINNVRNENE